MSIRDQYKVTMASGSEYVVAATKQGGKVSLETDSAEEFFIAKEMTKGGLTVRELRVAKSLVSAVEYKPGA